MRQLSENAQRIGWDVVAAILANGILLMVSALVLWPMGRAALAGQIALGLCVFAVATVVVYGAGCLIIMLLRIEDDPPSNAYIVLNLIMGALLQLGWAAFVALAVTRVVPGTPRWMAAVLYLIGLLASLFAKTVVDVAFRGHIYKAAAGLMAIVGYLVFAIWPGTARALLGWVFV